MDKKKKMIIIVVVILLLLIGAAAVYSLGNREPEANEDTNTQVETTQEDNSSITVDPGDTLTWSSEGLEFVIPEGWKYEIGTNDLYQEEVQITGNSLSAVLRYVKLSEDEAAKNWNDQENIQYSNTRSVLYEKGGELTVQLNVTMELTSFNYETEESSEEIYGLRLILERDGQPVTTLTEEELATIKFFMDSYEESVL